MTAPLWITYAWKDNDESDFDYLVQSLRDAGVEARYDKVALVPGQRLWEQIADRLGRADLSGWAYLVTPASLASQACREELAYALDRALTSKGAALPLIGLLHGVAVADVPLPLKVRLCIDLRTSDWREQVRAAVERRPPRVEIPEASPYVIRLHDRYLGKPEWVAVEARPRFGELMYWRFAFPAAGPRPIKWGWGPANGGGIAGRKSGHIEGKDLRVQGVEMNFVGAANTLSPATSAYLVFEHELPQLLFFGTSTEEFGTSIKGTAFSVSR